MLLFSPAVKSSPVNATLLFDRVQEIFEERKEFCASSNTGYARCLCFPTAHSRPENLILSQMGPSNDL